MRWRARPGGLESSVPRRGVGSAGVSNPQARALLEQTLAPVRDTGARFFLTGDQETALRAGALGAPCGMRALIAGTGSICVWQGCSPGKTARSGGYAGIKSDDEWQRLCARQNAHGSRRGGRRDGRGPRTLLTDLVFGTLKVADVGGLVQFTHDPQTDTKQIAALAPLVARAYEAGDEAAKKRWWKKHATSWRCWWSR
ncbi:MAG: hypothetical protein ACLVEX_02460 [Ruthenibacterium lactatiformans]